MLPDAAKSDYFQTKNEKTTFHPQYLQKRNIYENTYICTLCIEVFYSPRHTISLDHMQICRFFISSVHEDCVTNYD